MKGEILASLSDTSAKRVNEAGRFVCASFGEACEDEV